MFSLLPVNGGGNSRLGLAGSRQGGRPWPQGPSPGSAGPLRFTSKNKHVPQAWPVPPGQSRLCARPAASAAQAILISVWVHAAGVTNQSPRSSAPAPRLPPPVPLRASCWKPRVVKVFRVRVLPLEQVVHSLSLSFPVIHSTHYNQPPRSVTGVGR